MASDPLSAAALETRLDASLDPALSARRTTHLAEALAVFTRSEQEFVLRWTDIIARTNTEMAYLFATHAPEGLRCMALGDIEAWIVQAMDVTVRHLSKLLKDVEARTKLLITLSDGKPDDYDGYRGDYGIEDTRQALIEAKRDGIHPFCITINTEARDYLPHLYGAVNWALVDDVKKLPLKVSDIYRRLTT